MVEVFRPIEGFSKYEISNQGNVRNKKTNRILRPQDNGIGYKRCYIVGDDGQRKQKLVHRLVCCSFVPRNGERIEVDHIDRDKNNNVVWNLRWATRGENCRNR